MQLPPDELPTTHPAHPTVEAPVSPEPDAVLRFACSHFDCGEFDQATALYRQLVTANAPASLAAQACNDLAVLDCVRGNLDSARALLHKAVSLDPSNEAARANLTLLGGQDPPTTTSPPPADMPSVVVDCSGMI